MTNETNGHAYTLLSGSSSVLAWITLHDMQVIMTLLATGVAILSGALAVYCYIQKIKSKSW
jgi:hypothetical protein